MYVIINKNKKCKRKNIKKGLNGKKSLKKVVNFAKMKKNSKDIGNY